MNALRIRAARQGDLPQLFKIWNQVFGDEERYIKLYFERFFHENQAMALLLEDHIVSAVYMPILGKLMTLEKAENQAMSETLESQGNLAMSKKRKRPVLTEEVEAHFGDEAIRMRERPCASVYSFGTLPEYRGKGFGGQLLRAALEKSLGRGSFAGVICPAEDSLFEYYKGFGYRDYFSVREVEGNRKLFLENEKKIAETAPVPICGGISVEAAEAEEYQVARDRFLRGLGCSFISFDFRSLSHQKEISGLYGGGLYLLKGSEEVGCCCIEYGDRETLLVKEILFSEAGVAEAMRTIARMFPAQRYLFRMPVLLGKGLGGKARRFGMLLEGQGTLSRCKAGDLNINVNGVDGESDFNRCCASVTKERTGFDNRCDFVSEEACEANFPTGYYGFAFD